MALITPRIENKFGKLEIKLGIDICHGLIDQDMIQSRVMAYATPFL